MEEKGMNTHKGFLVFQKIIFLLIKIGNKAQTPLPQQVQFMAVTWRRAGNTRGTDVLMTHHFHHQGFETSHTRKKEAQTSVSAWRRRAV